MDRKRLHVNMGPEVHHRLRYGTACAAMCLTLGLGGAGTAVADGLGVPDVELDSGTALTADADTGADTTVEVSPERIAVIVEPGGEPSAEAGVSSSTSAGVAAGEDRVGVDLDVALAGDEAGDLAGGAGVGAGVEVLGNSVTADVGTDLESLQFAVDGDLVPPAADGLLPELGDGVDVPLDVVELTDLDALEGLDVLDGLDVADLGGLDGLDALDGLDVGQTVGGVTEGLPDLDLL